MAKNLKINIKNAQLANILNKTSTKKASSQKTTKSKKEPKDTAATEEEAPKKRVIKARKNPTTFSKPEPKPVEVEKEPVIEKEEILKEEVLPPIEPSETLEEPAVDVVEDVVEKVEEEKPPVEKKPTASVKKPPVEKPLPKKEEKKPAAADTTSSRKDKKKGKKGSGEDSYSKDAAKKSAALDKRQSFSRVFNWRDQDLGQAEEEFRRRRRGKGRKQAKIQAPVQRPAEISVKLPISVKDLSNLLKIKASEIIQKLFTQGIPITVNDSLNDSTLVELIGHELGCKVHIDLSEEKELQITDQTIAEEIADTDESLLESRPPIVTIMGHVDHGKTSIIDAYRKSDLASQEAGAITQHIGAFVCKTKHGNFTILDTPGHKAFSEIRKRGAHVTDIVVLVVAGDDGIKPQTEEAIEKAKEAKVPIIVALNKMDKPEFDADNVYRQLADHELLPEAWGGQTVTIHCSAKTGEGLDTLGEMIALQSEVLELKANPRARARGTVLESQIHKGLGTSATLLVQNGTLKMSDAVVFDHECGRIKTMQDEHNSLLKHAEPSIPVKVTGLSEAPSAGSPFVVVKSEKQARKIVFMRESLKKKEYLQASTAKNMDELLAQKNLEQQKKTLKIILKADVDSSLKAIQTSIQEIKTDKVHVQFISSNVGKINESDLTLAEISKAIIVGFHTKIDATLEKVAKQKKIPIYLHDVIYHLVDSVQEHMTSILDKVREEVQVGEAKVLATFKASDLGVIAGCMVVDGVIKRNHFAKLLRDGEILWEGNIASLKRHKDPVKEVKKDLECGIVLENFQKVQEDDIIQTFDINYKKQTL